MNQDEQRASHATHVATVMTDHLMEAIDKGRLCQLRLEPYLRVHVYLQGD